MVWLSGQLNWEKADENHADGRMSWWIRRLLPADGHEKKCSSLSLSLPSLGRTTFLPALSNGLNYNLSGERNKLISLFSWVTGRGERSGPVAPMHLKYTGHTLSFSETHLFHFTNSWCNKWSPRTVCLSPAFREQPYSSLAFWSPGWWETLKVPIKAAAAAATAHTETGFARVIFKSNLTNT